MSNSLNTSVSNDAHQALEAMSSATWRLVFGRTEEGTYMQREVGHRSRWTKIHKEIDLREICKL